MTFEKQPGVPLNFRFFIPHILYDSGTGPKVAFWISHEDEQRGMREAGLIPSGMNACLKVDALLHPWPGVRVGQIRLQTTPDTAGGTLIAH